MPAPSPVDLSNGQSFAQGFPHAFFRRLRAEEPVFWHEPTEHTPGGEGFWVVSRYDDVEHVFRSPDLFSSEKGPGRAFGGTALMGEFSNLWMAEFGGILVGKSTEATDGTYHAFTADLMHVKATRWIDSAVVQAVAFHAITSV